MGGGAWGRGARARGVPVGRGGPRRNPAQPGLPLSRVVPGRPWGAPGGPGVISELQSGGPSPARRGAAGDSWWCAPPAPPPPSPQRPPEVRHLTVGRSRLRHPGRAAGPVLPRLGNHPTGPGAGAARGVGTPPGLPSAGLSSPAKLPHAGLRGPKRLPSPGSPFFPPSFGLFVRGRPILPPPPPAPA